MACSWIQIYHVPSKSTWNFTGNGNLRTNFTHSTLNSVEFRLRTWWFNVSLRYHMSLTPWYMVSIIFRDLVILFVKKCSMNLRRTKVNFLISPYGKFLYVSPPSRANSGSTNGSSSDHHLEMDVNFMIFWFLHINTMVAIFVYHVTFTISLGLFAMVGY